MDTRNDSSGTTRWWRTISFTWASIWSWTHQPEVAYGHTAHVKGQLQPLHNCEAQRANSGCVENPQVVSGTPSLLVSLTFMCSSKRKDVPWSRFFVSLGVTESRHIFFCHIFRGRHLEYTPLPSSREKKLPLPIHVLHSVLMWSVAGFRENLLRDHWRWISEVFGVLQNSVKKYTP